MRHAGESCRTCTGQLWNKFGRFRSDMVQAGLTKVLATRDMQVRAVGSSRTCRDRAVGHALQDRQGVAV
jgi:hypothetical protein